MLLKPLQKILELAMRLFRRLRLRIRRFRGHTLNFGWTYGLPVEVLEHIFEACYELRNDPDNWRLMQPTLGAAARVCRVWHELATEYLYRDVNLSSMNALRHFQTTLEEHTHLRPLVHHFRLAYPAFVTKDIELPKPDDCFRSKQALCDLCPNLKFEYCKLPGIGGPELLKFGDSGVQNVTHLVLRGKGSFLVERGTVSPSSIELPKLQSLEVFTIFANDKKLEWFRMPLLRRLAVTGLVIPGDKKFTLPEHSPLIDTIEVLSCYNVIDEFFIPESSPLLPLRTSLARLAIKATMGRQRDTPEWSLGFLTSLKQLCIPFNCLLSTSITDFPPNLVELAFIGDTRDDDELSRMLGRLALLGMLSRKDRYGLGKLKRAIVKVPNTENWATEFKGIVTGVHLELGDNSTPRRLW